MFKQISVDDEEFDESKLCIKEGKLYYGETLLAGTRTDDCADFTLCIPPAFLSYDYSEILDILPPEKDHSIKTHRLPFF